MKVSALAFLLAAVPALADQDYDLDCPLSLASGSTLSQSDFLDAYLWRGCRSTANCLNSDHMTLDTSAKMRCNDCPDGLASDLVKGCTLVPSYRHIP